MSTKPSKPKSTPRRPRPPAAQQARSNHQSRPSEDYFRALFDHNLDAVFLTTPNGQILAANPAACALFGMSEAELCRAGLDGLVDPDDPRHLTAFQERGRTGRLSKRELGYIRNNGQRFPAEVDSVLLPGDPPGAFVILRDITERKHVEAALRESEQKFKTMIETSPLAIYASSGIDQKASYVNPTFVRLLGYALEDVPSATEWWLAAYPDESYRNQISAEWQRKVEHAIQTNSAIEPMEVVVTCKDGSHKNISWGYISTPTTNYTFGLDLTARKQAEEALRASEERLRLAQQVAQVGSFEYDPQAHTSHWSPELEALHGLPPGAGPRTYTEWAARVHPDDLPEAERRLRESLETGHFEGEWRVVWPDGTIRWLAARGKLFKDDAGKPLRLVGANLDITERKAFQAELERLVEERTAQWKAEAHLHQAAAEALRSSQRQLAAAMDLARLGNWEYDVATGLFTFDDRFFSLYGTTADRENGYQMPAETFAREFVHPDDAHLVAEEIEKALAATDPNYSAQLEARICRRDGQIRHILVRLAITKDAAGHTVTLHGINQDITERKLAEQQLADALDLNQKMIAASPMGIVAYKASGQCVFCNEALARIAGGPVSKILEGNFRHLANWERSGLLRLAQEALDRQEVRSGEFHDTTRFGKTIWVEAIMAPFVSGGELHLLHMSYDITGRKRLERQILEISDREQARIGQDLHDGPCQQLITLAFDANSLERDLSAQAHPHAVTARRFADLLDQSITETRQLARGLFPIRLQADGLVPALEELARTTSHRSQVPCRFESQGEAPLTDIAVATHLYRIAQEALHNAVKHGRPKKITLKLLASPGMLELTVEDDGRGISPAALSDPAHMGLHIMDYRARTIGATLRLAPASHAGTILTCRLPIPAHHTTPPPAALPR